MLVGDLAPLAPRGRSAIVGRVAPDATDGVPGWGPGLLALAPTDDQEAIVAVDVPHPGG